MAEDISSCTESALKFRTSKHTPAIVWRRLDTNVRIQGLKPNNYAAAVQLLKEHYVGDNFVCKSLGLHEDEISVLSFLKHTKSRMKGNTSLVAVDEAKGGQVIGILECDIVRREDMSTVFAATLPSEGTAYVNLKAFTNYLSRKANIVEEMNCDTYLRCGVICVDPAYKNHGPITGLRFELLKVAKEMAQLMGIPVIAGIFYTRSEQREADKLDMKVLYKIIYGEYLNNSTGESLFPNNVTGTCVFAAGQIPPLIIDLPSLEQSKKPKSQAKLKKGKGGKKDKKSSKSSKSSRK